MRGTGRMGLVLAGAVLLAGCHEAASVVTTTPATAEEVARTVLEELYSAGAQDSADFEEALARSATGESALDDYLTAKVGDKVSAEGLDTLLDNRVVTRVLNAWPAAEVKVDEVDLEDAYTATEESQTYRYTVTAAPEGESGESFTGEITLALTDDGLWQVTGVS